MTNEVKVLDHGFVRLTDSMGSDLSIVRAARVSYDAAWRAGKDQGSDERLIKYLWRNQHSTPFEGVVFTFAVKAPIFVIRQWHRHRTWSYNEVSARYTELPEDVYIPSIEVIGKQSASNKQARDIGEIDDHTAQHRQSDLGIVKEHHARSFAIYKRLIFQGWPRELARTVLPVATYTKMSATVNLWNLLKFITLRDDDHAQYEIRVYAAAMRELIRPIVPVAVAAWEETRRIEHDRR